MKFLNRGVIQINPEHYLSLLIIIAPLLNFLSGINIDLYAPSLPSIANYFSASAATAKNTITMCMLGFAVGCLIFGPLIDSFGRRRILLLGLAIYVVTSLLAVFSVNIHELMILRFIQGMTASTVAIAPRAMIMDSFSGHRYQIGMLYTSLAYGLGPIIGPFIGGLLEYHFGWRANFLAYVIVGLSLLIMVSLYINESISQRKPFSWQTAFSNYLSVIKHTAFIAGVIIGSGTQVEMIIYPTVGSFLVENVMHSTAIVYGYSALLISCGYLFGTLTNRLLVQKLHLHHITVIGFTILVLGTLLQIIFALFATLNLFTLILPIAIIGFSNGLIFPNVLGRCLRLFPNNAGIATAVFTCLLMSFTAIAIFAISYININGLAHLTSIFVITVIVQLVIFFGYFQRITKLT